MPHSAYFKNDDVMKQFYAQAGQRKALSRLGVCRTANFGDFWRLVYRRTAFRKLKHLSLWYIDCSSKASRLFAKRSSWCSVEVLNVSTRRSVTPRTSAYFIVRFLSSCTMPKELYVYHYDGCGIESFALESRARLRHYKQYDSQGGKLKITTSKNRASLKLLLATALKVVVAESLMLTQECSKNFRESFGHKELQYWEHIDWKNVGKFLE